jgi:hypothetical protein
MPWRQDRWRWSHARLIGPQFSIPSNSNQRALLFSGALLPCYYAVSRDNLLPEPFCRWTEFRTLLSGRVLLKLPLSILDVARLFWSVLDVSNPSNELLDVSGLIPASKLGCLCAYRAKSFDFQHVSNPFVAFRELKRDVCGRVRVWRNARVRKLVERRSPCGSCWSADRTDLNVLALALVSPRAVLALAVCDHILPR